MTTEITDEYVQAQLDEGLRCIGCGALMQITDPEKAGYLPLSALKKPLIAMHFSVSAVLDYVIITKSNQSN